MHHHTRKLGVGAVVVAALAVPSALARPLPLPTTSADFFAGGSQPSTTAYAPFAQFFNCQFCHADFDYPQGSGDPDFRAPGRWAGSLHAHAARDPLFLAAVAIANQDASNSGEVCWRCHAPAAWLEGRVIGQPSGSGLTSSDFDNGVSCHACHRIVKPAGVPVGAPPEDGPILAALTNPPIGVGQGQYIMDPQDRRRAPNNLDADWQPNGWAGFHDYLQSPYHKSSVLCGTCHDVSNPALSKQGDGTYKINPVNQPHPTGNPDDMFPEQRTYAEWLQTPFANGGVNMNGRWGGNLATVSQCQDCHMKDQTGQGCQPDFEPPVRNDLPHHGFAGGNRWMIDMIQHVYAGDLVYYQMQALDAAKADVDYMMQNATDMACNQTSAELLVRITNQCGHKLFTAYPEGRRGWVNVRYLDSNMQLIAERGHYDNATATLTQNDTKVYEVKHGLDAYMSAATGVPAGHSFHLVLNNTIVQDNRIPPRGFTNAAFAAIGSPVVGYTYADGQYWDDTCYFIPAGAAFADVRMYHQVATREYIEFLLNSNITNNAGVILYNAWIATGMSPPFEMDHVLLPIGQFILGDLNGDHHVNTSDLTVLLGNFGGSGKRPSQGDLNGDGLVNTIDLTILLGHFGQSF